MHTRTYIYLVGIAVTCIYQTINRLSWIVNDDINNNNNTHTHTLSHTWSVHIRWSLAYMAVLLTYTLEVLWLWRLVYPKAVTKISMKCKVLLCFTPIAAANLFRDQIWIQNYPTTLSKLGYISLLIAEWASLFVAVPYAYFRYARTHHTHSRFLKKMCIFAFIFIPLAHIAIVLSRFGNRSAIGAVMIAFLFCWSVILLIDKHEINSHQKDFGSVLLLSFAVIASPVGFGTVVVNVFEALHDNPNLKFLIFMAWGALMGSWYILWRRTSLLAIGGLSPQSQYICSLLTFPIQLFDDLFTDILFLSVEPFSALFVSMIVFGFVRDIIRDSGVGWVVWDYIRGKHEIDMNVRCRDMLLRYHLGEQNLCSELLAGVVVPTAVACDYVYNKLDFGVNTITKGMTSTDQIGVLQMYGVLLCVEMVTHVVVRYLLKRQINTFRGVLVMASEQQPHTHSHSPANTNNYTSVRASSASSSARRMSIINTFVEWDSNSHNNKYWRTHVSYFMCMIVYTVINVLFYSAQLKHQLDGQ